MEVKNVLAYYGDEKSETASALSPAVSLDILDRRQAASFHRRVSRTGATGGWPSWMISTHDYLGLAMRLKGDQTDMAAMVLLTLAGTPI